MPGPDAADFGTVVGMRVIAALALVLLLSACVPTSPEPTPTPSPAVTPVFASEEEALAAAEEAYAAYQAATDLVTASGGKDASPLRDLVTADQYQRELEGFEAFAATGWRTVGMSTFDSMQLQSYVDAGSVQLGVYVCSDVSMVRLVDGAGADVTPPKRPNRLPLVVTFESAEDNGLLVASSDLWDGGGLCAS